MTKYAERQLLLKRDGYKCSECGLEEWRGKSISLQVHDHGKPTARFMCPNCHVQTPDWAGRGKPSKKRGIPISDEQRRKQSLAIKGKKRSAESIAKQSKTLTGRKRPEHSTFMSIENVRRFEERMHRADA